MMTKDSVLKINKKIKNVLIHKREDFLNLYKEKFPLSSLSDFYDVFKGEQTVCDPFYSKLSYISFVIFMGLALTVPEGEKFLDQSKIFFYPFFMSYKDEYFLEFHKICQKNLEIIYEIFGQEFRDEFPREY